MCGERDLHVCPGGYIAKMGECGVNQNNRNRARLLAFPLAVISVAGLLLGLSRPGQAEPPDPPVPVLLRGA